MLVSAAENLPVNTPWRCTVLDYYSRKHTHVVRSTFAAELHALLGAVGQAVLINLAITELYRPIGCAGNLAKLQDSGELWPPLEAFMDAKAVFDAIAVDTVKIPTEKNLYIHLVAAKDLLTKGTVRDLHWIDTQDMLADGMTKGSIDRDPLRKLGAECTWRLRGQRLVSYSSQRQV